MPDWILILIMMLAWTSASLLTFFWIKRWTTSWHRYINDRNGVVCTNCAYDMTEVEPDTCPECGERFDAAAAKKRWSEYLNIYPHFK